MSGVVNNMGGAFKGLHQFVILSSSVNMTIIIAVGKAKRFFSPCMNTFCDIFDKYIQVLIYLTTAYGIKLS